jgi:hypothetical protein
VHTARKNAVPSSRETGAPRFRSRDEPHHRSTILRRSSTEGGAGPACDATRPQKWRSRRAVYLLGNLGAQLRGPRAKRVHFLTALEYAHVPTGARALDGQHAERAQPAVGL